MSRSSLIPSGPESPHEYFEFGAFPSRTSSQARDSQRYAYTLSQCPTIATEYSTSPYTSDRSSHNYTSTASTSFVNSTFVDSRQFLPLATSPKPLPRTSQGQFPLDDGHVESSQPPVSKDYNGRDRWRSIRRTVSHILRPHSKLKDTQIPSPLSSSVSANVQTSISAPRPLKPSKSTTLKSSSASLSLKRSRVPDKRLTITPPGHIFDDHRALAMTRKHRVRRSRSFSGYPNLLAVLSEENDGTTQATR
ncbi:hypothetical protein H0H87_001048 [Tephrocybe sp. NHM501043]|nr:hypothetical protein H0H87_001048 [Tephrocybe sp. NHM501043]